MSETTQVLRRPKQESSGTAEDLLPLVYEELRKLAASRLAKEQPGLTLQPTALVHEAYVRLLGTGRVQQWDSRGHFFAAAAIAMRRILVERARRQGRMKHGGGLKRVDLSESQCESAEHATDLLDLDAALDRLAAVDPQAAELVKLRYFVGLTIPEAAELLEISSRKADFMWSFARAWLRRELAER
jgi:RNA polymerase sigma factor (TIGR02999 family)